MSDKKGKGSGSKDACYHKVKASASVWPSAYASGRLVQCRKVGASNYGKSKNEGVYARMVQLAEEAWTRKEGQSESGGLNAKGRASLRAKGQNIKAPVTQKNPKGKAKKRRASFCARMGGMKKRLTSKKTANDPDSRINKALRKWNC